MRASNGKIVWVSPLVLDSFLHKTTQIEILKSLSARGYTTVLFAMRSKKRFNAQSYKENISNQSLTLFLIPIRYFPVIAPLIYAFVTTLLLYINVIKSNPDYVIIEPDISIISSLPSVIISKIRKTKFVLDIRSVPVEIKGFRGTLNIFCFNISVLIAKRLFSGITTITPLMKKEICTKFSISENKIGVWTSGVAVNLFNPDIWNLKGKELKSKLGLFEKFVVFYHGNISATRGIKETLKAIKILSKGHPEIVLFILGSGPYTSQLRSSIRNQNLQNNAFVHNAVEYEMVPEYISMGDVCIIPLPDYPFWRPQSPLKLLEYMAMKKVIILTDLFAHRNVLHENKCGVYLASTNPKEIANGIKFALKNKTLLNDWGDSGREIVLNNYSWEKVAKDLEGYICNLK